MVGTGPACKPRGGPSSLRADDSVAITSPFDAEDFAILLPVEKAILSKTFGSLGELTQALDGTALIPLSRMMAFGFYRDQFLPALLEPAPGELNPFAADDALEAWNHEPEAQWKSWYVTAVHFVPCGLPDLPVPSSWMKELALGPAHLGCRPKIRLSVQKFGVADCPMTCSEHFGIADDKALHLVYSFTGDDAFARVAEADQAAKAALVQLSQLASANPPSREQAVQALRGAYEPAKEAFAALRMRFLHRVDGLRDAAASGDLRLEYGAKAALPRIKKYVEKTLTQEAALDAVTQAFIVTDRTRVDQDPDPRYPGPKPGFAQRWFFAKYLPRTTDATKRQGYLQTAAPHATLLQRVRLTFPFETAAKTLGELTAGQVEVFDDAPGTLLGLDADLKDSLAALPLADRDPAFLSTGFQDYAFFRKRQGDLVLENAQVLRGKIPDADIAKATRAGYQRVVDPSLHDAGDASCVSCHVVTGVAVRREREANASNNPALNIGRLAGAVTGDNFTIKSEALGPGSSAGDLGQARPLGETWIVRAFGYYGWTPVIADRLVAEVKEDVAFANASLQGL